MVHYIRYLKLPKAVRQQANIAIKALITITTDLGDSFFEGSITLTASIRGEDLDSVYLERKYKWEAPRRALNIELLLKHGGIRWPARLHVGVDDSEVHDYVGSEQIPAMISIWGAIPNPSGPLDKIDLVQRRFRLLDNSVLVIWEESVESIARHIW